MNKHDIDEHLCKLDFVKKYQQKVDGILKGKLNVVDEISDFILNNQEYNYLKSFNELADGIVEFIENYNSNLLDFESIKLYVDNFKTILRCLEKDINSRYKITIYFFGKDKYSFIKNNLTNDKVINITSLKQLMMLSLSKKNNEKEYNVLLLGNENVSFENIFFDEILLYNKIAESLESAMTSVFCENYDFNFLQRSLERCLEEKELNSIVVGNSYSLVGISEYELNRKAVKLSNQSQDLYYSIMLAKKAIELNSNIKECILGISYYVLRHDLSRGRNEYSKSLMKKIYIPLLKDFHNSEDNYNPELMSINDFKVDVLIKSIFDLEKIEKFISKKLRNLTKTYYNDSINCRRNETRWNDLSKEEKKRVDLNRAYIHNRMIKYENTKYEYTILLKDFIEFLKNKGIKLNIVVLPTTREYYENIIPELKREFEFVLEYLKNNNANILDLREYLDEYDDLDFWDSDHLNSNGEKKSTRIINSIIK